MRVLREPSVRVVAYQKWWTSWEVVYGPAPTNMLIRLEGAEFCVSIFGGIEHLRCLLDCAQLADAPRF